MKRPYFYGASALAVALTLASWGTAAYAQRAPANNTAAASDTEVAEVQVVATGSYIAGENTALPVAVTGHEELEQRGSPSMVQLIKTLPSSGSVIGENNRFGNGNGGATVNLRNLGSTRTLVLFNGRRLPGSAQGLGAVDVNLLPLSAIGRVEILKDGAAATYGSDAIGGVVNFITRRDINGLEVNGQYQFIDGSNGDWSIGGVYGWHSDNARLLVSLDYRERSELPVQARDWALRTGVAGYLQNPLGGWAGTGNPGAYNYVTGAAPVGSPTTGFTSFSATGVLPDIGCAANGGAPYTQGVGPVSATACVFQYTTFDNLVENEQHYQAYANFEVDVNEALNFHTEVLFARNVTPLQSWALTGPNQSPAPILASGGSPGGGVSPIPATGTSEQSRFYIPASNPGLQALLGQLATANCAGPIFPYGIDAATCATGLAGAQAAITNANNYGVLTSATGWRPVGFAGNPATSDRHNHYSYDTTTYRVAGGFSGHFWNGINFDAGMTYQDLDTNYNLQDISVNRLQLALRGLGGAGCNPVTGTPGTGNCHYFDPFTNAFAQSTSNVPANPYYIASSAIPGFNDAVANRAALVDWMQSNQYNEINTQIFVTDLVLNGQTGIHLFGASDPVAWAVGTQYRYDRTVQTPDVLYDANATPCVDSLPYGDGAPFCPTTSNGPFLFNANIRPYDVTRKIYSAFGEVRLPLGENVEVTLAGRFEDYAGLGTTTTPKASIRWQALPWLALRGSVGTTYRAPPATVTTTGFVRGLSNASGTYRANDLYGNPNLRPETADTYDVGLIIQTSMIHATVDYWHFSFSDQITTEAVSDLLGVINGSGVGGGHCNDPNYASALARITFSGAACSTTDATKVNSANILSYRTLNINGGGIDTAGIDASVDVRLPWDVFSGDLSLGMEGTYLTQYDENPYLIEGHPTAPATIHRVGTYRSDLFLGYNRIRANAYLNWHMGRHNLRWQVRYVSLSTNINATAIAVAAPVNGNLRIAEYYQHDLTYRVELPWDSSLTVSVQNLLDTDPPFAFGTQYNYDFSSGNPLGRVIAVSVRKHF